MSAGPSSVKKAWWKWKALRFPWRRKWLVGFDLTGNTFWEFRDQIAIGRMRRIVHYANEVHYADVKVAPQWMQWLRHTRSEPPSINEQQLDEIRQVQLKELAAAADARWASKASAIHGPSKNNPLIAGRLNGGEGSQIQVFKNAVVKPVKLPTPKVEPQLSEQILELKEQSLEDVPASPWKEIKTGKGKEQQPEAWTPKLAKRR
ncbi:hypothetical protein EJ08DRAFT_651721 [Tothia fuscella]|uniref:NADH dehydrogenase [ubiquinone] 1 alpha subcomplex subunit n=1 Tax=Tothia fuscella TaxID=1048955 RepID=A0A9P4NLD5_9PEZI|nr:hypothetical protein EJ08DRAFT_651721 [Tothia fuscella]